MRYLLPFLVGCTSTLPDPAYTAEVCGIEKAHPIITRDYNNPPELSADCIGTILGDLNADIDSLESGSGVQWEELVSDPSAYNTPIGSVVVGGWGLLALDWGVESGPGLYVDIAASFNTVIYEDLDGKALAAYSPFGKKLKVAVPLTAPRAAGVLVHELSHTEGTRHVKCHSHSEQKNCDIGWDGAYGRQIQFLEAGHDQSTDELARQMLEREIESLAQYHIF